MSIFGIVCEFNPFHNGHKRIIDKAKELGAEKIVCVMSGNAVQRGELSMLDKYDRAMAAVRCGADLVLELPYPWSASSAECFADCAIGVLSHFCGNVIFGSECGDIERLENAAQIILDDGFKLEYRTRLQNGDRAATAYFSLLEEKGYNDFSSNDILGIEYIRAAKQGDMNIKFHTVKREGAAYLDEFLKTEKYPSATALRNAWKNGEWDMDAYVPIEATEIFKNRLENGKYIDINEMSRAILMYFRLADAEYISQFAENEGGIANRICAVANESVTLDTFFEKLKTKRYTDAKLRRAVLFALTKVTREMLSNSPEYVTLLGANEKGREMLSASRKANKIKVVTKPADAPKDSKQFEVDKRLEALVTLAQKNPLDTHESYRKVAFIK